jgi:hypothetical protein
LRKRQGFRSECLPPSGVRVSCDVRRPRLESLTGATLLVDFETV